MLQAMTKYSKGNKLDVRWQYGLFLGVSMSTSDIMVSGPDETREHGRSEVCQRTNDEMQTQ